MIAFFSGTGNSKYVAQRIADRLGMEQICINDRIKAEDNGSINADENLIGDRFKFCVNIKN